MQYSVSSVALLDVALPTVEKCSKNRLLKGKPLLRIQWLEPASRLQDPFPLAGRAAAGASSAMALASPVTRAKSTGLNVKGMASSWFG